MTRQEGKARCERLKQQMSKHLPRVRFDIDEDGGVTGVSTMSIVKNPAIESEFIAFRNDSPKLRRQRRIDKIKARLK